MALANLEDVARTGLYSDLKEIPVYAQSFQEMMATPTADMRVYTSDYLETIAARAELNGDYYLVLRNLGDLPTNVIDTEDIQIRIQSANLSNTLVHTESWTRVQDIRVIPFNISAAEASGAGARIQRDASGRLYYHFIAVFRASGGNPLFTLGPTELWIEDETIPATPVTQESIYNENKKIITAGTNVSLTESDLDNTIRINATGGGGSADTGPDWEVVAFTTRTSLSGNDWLNKFYRFHGNTSAGLILPNIVTETIGGQLGVFNDSDVQLQVAAVTADNIGNQRVITLEPHESVILLALRDDDWEVVADAYKAQLALNRLEDVKTTADNALERTNRLLPLTVWEQTDNARTIYFEWKPVDAQHTNINATFVVGGNTINNVNPSSGVAALDDIGTVLAIPITGTQAQNITRSSNAIAGYVECQITVSGEILGSCWMTTSVASSGNATKAQIDALDIEANSITNQRDDSATEEWIGTEADYNAITTKDPNTKYLRTGDPSASLNSDTVDGYHIVGLTEQAYASVTKTNDTIYFRTV